MKYLSSFILFLACLTASAEDFTYTHKGNTLTYTVLNEKAFTCKVKDGKTASGDIVIPYEVKYGENNYKVTEIGNEAFKDCSDLTSVDIPNSVTTISYWAFYGCNGLTSVNIHDIAAWCNILLYYESNPLKYAQNLYLNGEKVTELVIPDGITSIGNYAFIGCCDLISVNIPNSVTSIGNYAFNGCI